MTPSTAHDRARLDTPRLLRSFEDLSPERLDPQRPVVTLFSGGLDSSYLLLRLVQAGFRDVHAVSVDLGDGETAEDQQQAAEHLGVHLHIVDGRQRFVDDFVRPAITAQAVYLDTHPISSSLSRPLIAEVAVGIARDLDASAILHTANRSQNTLRRLNGALSLLGYEGAFGSPYDLDPVDRDQKARELEDVGLVRMGKRIVSVDANLWCREFESGVLDDPEDHVVPEHLYEWSIRANQVTPTSVEVGFEAGVPTSLDGRPLELRSLIERLNQQVGAYGIGRYSGLEHLPGGQKVLELREMPAAWLLLHSYRHLETATLDAETIREKMHLEQVWVREALEGRWYGHLREATQSFIDVCATKVTGTVRWRLSPGHTDTQSIVARHPLYLRDREEWEKSSLGKAAPVAGG